MAWSTDRKRFAAAIALFVAWVAALALLAVVSSNRPSARTSPNEPPPGVTEVLGVP